MGGFCQGKGLLCGGLLCLPVVVCVLRLGGKDMFCQLGWEACCLDDMFVMCFSLMVCVVCVCCFEVYIVQLSCFSVLQILGHFVVCGASLFVACVCIEYTRSVLCVWVLVVSVVVMWLLPGCCNAS